MLCRELLSQARACASALAHTLEPPFFGGAVLSFRHLLQALQHELAEACDNRCASNHHGKISLSRPSSSSTSLPDSLSPMHRPGAVFIVVACLLVFLVFDVVSTRYLRSVILAAFGQYAAKTESVWALASKQAIASTLSSEIGGPASRCVLRAWRALTTDD